MEESSLKIIESMALEVTRRCNDKCPHCMRGDAQNIDMKKDIVDNLFARKGLILLKLVFSGGEPLLNEDLIIYTIDKIISTKALVFQIEITTNGIIYSKRVVEKLKEFKEYIKRNFKSLSDLIDRDEISCIRISNDQFHNYNEEIIKKYQEEKELSIITTGNIDEFEDELLLTGRAKNRFFGRQFEYKLKDINVRTINSNRYFFKNKFYITAKGNITTQGDGTYEDMDILNLGTIFDFEFINREKINLKKFKKIEKSS